MSFTTVTHLGREIFLLLTRPDVTDDGSHKISFSFSTNVDEGTSSRESRSPDYDWFRLEQSCVYTLRQADSASLLQGLASLGSKLVGMPLWCDLLTGATWSQRALSSGYILRLSDATILPPDSVLSPTEEYVPLMVGKLKEQPELAAWTSDGCVCEITVKEDSPPEYRIVPAVTVTAGAWPNSLAPDWTNEPLSRSSDGREYDQIGQGRERAESGQEAAHKWGQEAAFTLRTRAEWANLIGFFYACRGRWKAFTVPWWFQPAADAPETPHTLKARFASDTLQVSFTTPIATASIGFWQLPWEIVPPAGETAEQPRPGFGYKFSVSVPGGPLVWRYTDQESQVSLPEPGGTFVYYPAKIEHDRLSQDFMLADDSVTLRSSVMAAHPWLSAIQQCLEAPIELELRKFDPAEPNAAILRYVGVLQAPIGEGRRLKVKTSVLGGLLDTKVPNFFLQKDCNHDFCDDWCQLNEVLWTFASEVISVSGSQIVVLITHSPSVVNMADNFFANGVASKGLGESYESREIVSSAALGAGQHRLTLDRPFKTAATGLAVGLQPNCSGTWDECGRYGNQINYGGHRDIGDKNLSLPTRQTNMAAGKK
jgi:hypothetical protein